MAARQRRARHLPCISFFFSLILRKQPLRLTSERIGSRRNLRYFKGDILNGFASLSFLEYRPKFFEIGLKAGQAFAIFTL